MHATNPWETFYRQKPAWAISWLDHPDDYLRALIKDGTIKKGTALDLGCGVGDKSVFLAKNGFTVTGVDLAPTAIREARALAEKEKVTADFLLADITEMPALKNPFNFVLDFSTFHIIPEAQRPGYFNELQRLTRPGSQYFLRVFSKRAPQHELGFFRSDTTKEITYAFNRGDIEQLFGEWFTIKEERETDFTEGNKKLALDEYLMERI